MTDVIKNWIERRLGIIFDISSPNFPTNIRDGRLVAKLLYTYDVIDKQQLNQIYKSIDPVQIQENFKHIQIWLKSINITVDDDINLFGHNGSYTLKLLYQIYLVLQEQSKLNFATSRKKNEQLAGNYKTRFSVSYILNPTLEATTVRINPLAENILKNQQVLDWEKQRYCLMKENVRVAREKYREYLQEKFNLTFKTKPQNLVKTSVIQYPKDVYIDTAECENMLEDYTYEELLQQECLALSKPPFVPDPRESKRIVKKLKDKHKETTKKNFLKVQMQKLLMAELWEAILRRQQKELEEKVAEKMLKQSLYEKQMATKMFEIRHHKERMLEDRQVLDAELSKARDQEFLQKMFTKDADQKLNIYYAEKERAFELHRRVYEEKMRLRAERIHNFCQDTADDLVDLSIRYSEYKEEFNAEPDKRIKNDWTSLFIKEQPIFDIVEPVEDILEYYPSDILTTDVEELYVQEIERQDALDMMNFEQYCKFYWPWELEYHWELPEEVRAKIDNGMNVLGYIVHRVLLAKYPKPEKPPKPDLPDFKVAVCIKGLTDLTIIPTLQKLLNRNEIAIIQLQDAINYCLEAYKNEIITEIVDEVFVEATEKSMNEIKSKPSKKLGKKSGGGKKNKKKDKSPVKKKKGQKKAKSNQEMIPDVDSIMEAVKFHDKANQTPRLYPCEELVLSSKAELGKVAYELLNLGEPLNDHLLTAIFLEYLKNLKNSYGWAIVNYPETIEQAVMLEEKLTAQDVPVVFDHLKEPCSIDDFIEAEERETKPGLCKDPYLDVRMSKLVEKPLELQEDVDYETCLTAFIQLKPASDPLVMGQEYVPVEEEDILDKFYTEQGCNYLMEYKTYDFPTIKHLAKLIIGKFTVPPKKSIELFGDTVLYLEEHFGEDLGKSTVSSVLKGEKKKKKKGKKDKKSQMGPDGDAKKSSKKDLGKGGKGSKKGKSEKGSKKGKSDKKSSKKEKSDKSSGKKGKKGKKDKSVVQLEEIERAEKETQIPEPEEEPETPPGEPVPPPKPGELGWRYVTLPIPEVFEKALGTMWENMELNYITDFRELFFRRRVVLNIIMPYLTFVKNHMAAFITRPDNKQEHLYKFQKIFNQIEVDLRDDDEVKAELHCRIGEFKEKLFEMSDNKRTESENERQRIIEDHWISKQLVEITNIFIIALELEMDRCADTMQLINDYYTSMITKMPCGEAVIPKERLELIPEDFEIKTTKSIAEASSYMSNLLSKIDMTTSSSTPYHARFLKNYRTANNFVESLRKCGKEQWESMDGLFKPKEKGKGKGKKGKGKKEKKAPRGKKDKKSTTKEERKLPPFDEPDQETKDFSAALLEEWSCVMNAEIERVLLRFRLIKSVFEQDINDSLNCYTEAFHGIYKDIREYYENELRSIELACEVIGKAVEAEMEIQAMLVLDGDKFHINPNIQLFEEPLPEPELPLEEKVREYIFTVDQLEEMVNILQDLAPYGYLPERSFVFLLQDMIVQNAEDGKNPMVPRLWQKLLPTDVPEVAYQFFGNAEFVDWKDFVLYNLYVGFPTEEDLMNAREDFRCFDPDTTEVVMSYQYWKVKFWFEEEIDKTSPVSVYRLSRIKDLLYKMYRINEDQINYTALLLGFCKDVEPVKGFVKALELSLGKYVCWEIYMGEQYIQCLRNKRHMDEVEERRKEVEHNQKLKEAENLVVDIIDKVVHQCDSVVIEDYYSEPEQPDSFVDIPVAKSMKSIKSTESTDIDLINLMTPTITQNEVSPIVQKIVEKAMSMSDEGEKEDEIVNIFFSGDYEPDVEFSNVSIGFEADPNFSKMYFLPSDALLKIMTVSFPSYAKIQNVSGESIRKRIETLYESLRSPEFANAVFAHELLNHEEFKMLIGRSFKFCARDPFDIIHSILVGQNKVC